MIKMHLWFKVKHLTFYFRNYQYTIPQDCSVMRFRNSPHLKVFSIIPASHITNSYYNFTAAFAFQIELKVLELLPQRKDYSRPKCTHRKWVHFFWKSIWKQVFSSEKMEIQDSILPRWVWKSSLHYGGGEGHFFLEKMAAHYTLVCLRIPNK